uniref:CDK5 regulatory subunit associated protein 2 n=1 Tax=Scleropages formosus TaxID=113540 RepID=A0A8D0CH37_SCLFO
MRKFFCCSTNISRLPETSDVEDLTVNSMPACLFPGERISPVRALTMKDYENQITGLKKENFNLKLRIYFMEERMQQKFDDSAEDIFKTNIELKVEVESQKRELAEKQELLVSAWKALESLEGKESSEIFHVKEEANREREQLKNFYNKRIRQLEEDLKAAEDEVEKMATIAEQEKVRNIGMEKQLLAFGLSSTFTPAPTQDVHHVLQEKDSVIEQLRLTLKSRDKEIDELQRASFEQDKGVSKTFVFMMVIQMLSLIFVQSLINKQNEATALEAAAKQLTEELNSTKALIQNLKKTLEDEENENKILCMKLEEKENELSSEKKNALKRDKTIQGLTLVLKEKDKEIEELCHEIEDRDEALAKAREAAHKAQIQKYQGAEEHQSLLMEKQGELENLQLEHHGKVLEAQKLQRALQHREKELGSLQQAKEQLEQELEDLQQLKKKGDKAINDLQNKLKKLNGEMGERENALEQQYQALLDESKRKLQAHELTIQRLSSNLSEKEHQLQEYMKLIKDQEQRKSPGGSDILLAKLRERLKEKEAALEQAIDEKFAAIEEKDSEICQLQLSLREKERDLERLNKLLLHNEETINSFDALIKEKDVELQHLANSLKNLQRLKNELEDNLSRTLREKDTIISQLQLTVDEKSKDLEEMARSLLSQTQSNARDLAEHLSQQLKVAEAKLAEAMKDKERLVSDNENAVEGLIATINSKDQLLKETAEHYNRTIAERTQEIQDLKRQLTENRHLLATAEKQSAMTAQEKCIESAELRVMLTEKDTIINKLLENKEEREKFLEELKIMETPVPQVVELKHTIQVLQECLEEKEAELSRKNNSDSIDKNSVTKTAVILKKELAQKTDALNKALKAENNLKVRTLGLSGCLFTWFNCLNISSGIMPLSLKKIKLGDSKVYDFYDQTAEPKEERPLPSLPQRERTIIGGNSQQEVLPALSALLSEHERLNQSLKAEQQLYSDLVRIVKEQDSPQCLHALEMELTAVQLLRQQLEDGIQSNENLRQDLEREIQNAKQREGMESMRHQLEDAQRWNASLQARLGAIQNRGGGVGGTNDTADTFSFVADQTSYMSICVEDRLNDDLSHLSMVLELRDYIKQLQALNQEKKENSSVVEFSDMGLMGKEDSNVPRSALEKVLFL